ncbi:MAG: hypothetical protein NVSMB17_19910 [Candidatus Dormibacteria bacterium]
MHARLDGEALQRARLAKGLTHHQLARIVHLDAGERILAFERGTLEPNARIIVALAEALTLEPMQLLLLPNGVDLAALRLASGQGPAEVAQSVRVPLRLYLEWESGGNLPLEDARLGMALTRALSCSTEQIVQALLTSRQQQAAGLQGIGQPGVSSRTHPSRTRRRDAPPAR